MHLNQRVLLSILAECTAISPRDWIILVLRQAFLTGSEAPIAAD